MDEFNRVPVPNMPTLAVRDWLFNDSDIYNTVLRTLGSTLPDRRPAALEAIYKRWLWPMGMKGRRSLRDLVLKFALKFVDWEYVAYQFDEALVDLGYRPSLPIAERDHTTSYLPEYSGYRNEPTAMIARWLWETNDRLSDVKTRLDAVDEHEPSSEVKSIEADDLPFKVMRAGLSKHVYMRYEVLEEYVYSQGRINHDLELGSPGVDLLTWFMAYVDWKEVYMALGYSDPRDFGDDADDSSDDPPSDDLPDITDGPSVTVVHDGPDTLIIYALMPNYCEFEFSSKPVHVFGDGGYLGTYTPILIAGFPPV